MGRPVDITGHRFGRLVALSKDTPDANKRTRWKVRCDCGAEKVVDGAHMRYGRIRSCGCLQADEAPDHARRTIGKFAGHNRTHGRSRTPLYAVWKTMHDRCRNPNNDDYRFYGALGVTVCERWSSFENFLADMGERPEGLTLDRRDPEGDYSPGNCRWASWETQRANKRASPTAEQLAT